MTFGAAVRPGALGDVELGGSAEAVLEVSYLAAVRSWLGVQPAIPWHQAPRDATEDALVIVLRVGSSR